MVADRRTTGRECLVLRGAAVDQDGPLVRITARVSPDRAFLVEFCFLVEGAGGVRAVRVFDAHRRPDGAVRISGHLTDRHPSVEVPDRLVHAAFVPVAGQDEFFLRSADEARDLLALRRHWDRRYAIPGRTVLDHPHTPFLAWLAEVPRTGPVLVLGDGEGRNARAVPPQHPVTVVELSPVGAATCAARGGREVDVEVGDLFRWSLGDDRLWTVVAALYVGPFSDREFSVLERLLVACVERGGAVFLELARHVLPREWERRLCTRLGAVSHAYRHDADDTERVRVSSPA